MWDFVKIARTSFSFPFCAKMWEKKSHFATKWLQSCRCCEHPIIIWKLPFGDPQRVCYVCLGCPPLRGLRPTGAFYFSLSSHTSCSFLLFCVGAYLYTLVGEFVPLGLFLLNVLQKFKDLYHVLPVLTSLACVLVFWTIVKPNKNVGVMHFFYRLSQSDGIFFFFGGRGGRCAQN